MHTKRTIPAISLYPCVFQPWISVNLLSLIFGMSRARRLRLQIQLIGTVKPFGKSRIASDTFSLRSPWSPELILEWFFEFRKFSIVGTLLFWRVRIVQFVLQPLQYISWWSQPSVKSRNHNTLRGLRWYERLCGNKRVCRLEFPTGNYDRPYSPDRSASHIIFLITLAHLKYLERSRWSG